MLEPLGPGAATSESVGLRRAFGMIFGATAAQDTLATARKASKTLFVLLISFLLRIRVHPGRSVEQSIPMNISIRYTLRMDPALDNRFSTSF